MQATMHVISNQDNKKFYIYCNFIDCFNGSKIEIEATIDEQEMYSWSEKESKIDAIAKSMALSYEHELYNRHKDGTLFSDDDTKKAIQEFRHDIEDWIRARIQKSVVLNASLNRYIHRP